jgi:hypothetical protein
MNCFIKSDTESCAWYDTEDKEWEQVEILEGRDELKYEEWMNKDTPIGKIECVKEAGGQMMSQLLFFSVCHSYSCLGFYIRI